MSDKPLAEGIENWAKKLEEEWEIEIAQHLRGTILLIKDFAAEHLTEQTEPSEEEWKIARTHAGVGRPCENKDCYRCYSRAYTLLAGSNALRRRIRELLVGKETK